LCDTGRSKSDARFLRLLERMFILKAQRWVADTAAS